MSMMDSKSGKALTAAILAVAAGCGTKREVVPQQYDPLSSAEGLNESIRGAVGSEIPHERDQGLIKHEGNKKV